MKKLIVSLGLLFALPMAWAQTDNEKAAETVQRSTIEGHIYFLADDLLEGRGTGSRGLDIAASYLANRLRSYGIHTNPESGDYYQKFTLRQLQQPDSLSLTLNGINYPDAFALMGNAVSVTSEPLFLGYGMEADYKGTDVKGRMVVVRAGTSESAESRAAYLNRTKKRQLAIEHGATGLVELVTLPENNWSTLKHILSEGMEVADPDASQTPGFVHIWLRTTPEEATKLEATTLNLAIAMDGVKVREVTTQNVVGILEGTDPELKKEYVLYSAHYDHLGIGMPDMEGDSIYNGARDNAIGATAVLSMAENVGKYPTKRSALFVFFTAEEKGLLGSEYYASHPVIPMQHLVYGFNTDGAGYNNTEIATIIGLERTTAMKHIVNGAATFGLKAIGDPSPEQGLFDRSDNVSFARLGVPAPTYSTGFDAFDNEIMKYYHQAGDEADSLDYEYLLKFFRGYVLSGRLIANDPQTPTWVPGDTYEPAAKMLYKKENTGRPVKD